MEKDSIYIVDSPLYKLGYTAKVCQRYFNLFFKKNCSSFGVSEGEYVVLDTVRRNPEISQIDLARLLFKGRAHITQIMNSLEEKGLIKRVEGMHHSRKVLHTELTPKGVKIHEKIKSISKEKFIGMWKYFEEKSKKDMFMSMLSEIQEILTEGQPVKFD